MAVYRDDLHAVLSKVEALEAARQQLESSLLRERELRQQIELERAALQRQLERAHEQLRALGVAPAPVRHNSGAGLVVFVCFGLVLLIALLATRSYSSRASEQTHSLNSQLELQKLISDIEQTQRGVEAAKVLEQLQQQARELRSPATPFHAAP
jgi:hypothetical protein